MNKELRLQALRELAALDQQMDIDHPPCGFAPPTPGYDGCTRKSGHDGPCAHELTEAVETVGTDIVNQWVQDELLKDEPDFCEVGQWYADKMERPVYIHDVIVRDREREYRGKVVRMDTTLDNIYSKRGRIEHMIDRDLAQLVRKITLQEAYRLMRKTPAIKLEPWTWYFTYEGDPSLTFHVGTLIYGVIFYKSRSHGLETWQPNGMPSGWHPREGKTLVRKATLAESNKLNAGQKL
jgi:hypothetical protein